MEIIFNKALTQGITGKLRGQSPWYIRQRNGKYHAAYHHPKSHVKEGKIYFVPYECKFMSFRTFYKDLLALQKAHYISQIILTDQERRWLQ